MTDKVSDYEEFVEKTWVGSTKTANSEFTDLFICSLGLGGESGEVQEKLKKYVRDGVLDIPNLSKELGDVLYYLTTIGRMFGLSLETIMEDNVNKLTARIAKGTMHGSGDNR